MLTPHIRPYFLTATLMLLFIWLMVGVSKGDEFGELNVFLKHRPSFQVYFVSPLDMGDRPTHFPNELAVQEARYTEYVRNEHWSKHWFFVLLAQGCVLAIPIVLGIGLYKTWRNL